MLSVLARGLYEEEAVQEEPAIGMSDVLARGLYEEEAVTVQAQWHRIPRRQDGAEGCNVAAARPRRHPLDDLAEAGKVQDDGSQSGEEDSLSEESGDEEHSDDEDVFEMKAATRVHLSDAYRIF